MLYGFINRILILSIAAVMFNSCAMMNGWLGNPLENQKNEIIFSQSVAVTVQGSEKIQKAAGESLEIEGKPVFVEAPGYVGLIVVPTATKNGKIKVSLKPAAKWTTKGEQARNDIQNNAVVAEIVEGISSVQRLLIDNRGDDALDRVNELSNKFPQVTYLNFMKASCLVVVGKQQQAIDVLKTVLNDFPGNKQGKSLYKSLTGEEFLAH